MRHPNARTAAPTLAATTAVCLALAAFACSNATDGAGERAVVASAGLAQASLEKVTGFGSNPAGLTMYRYVPQGVAANAPLVLVLHGCTQTAADMVNAGWNTLADTYKFPVVYPEQTTANNALMCFNWAGVYGDTTDLKRGQGENLSIKQMVDKMKSDLSIDGKRVFAVGFSSGGAEAALMLATWPDVFAGGATFGGIPYDCAESVAASQTCMKPGKDQSAKTWGDLVRAAYPGYTGPWPRLSIWQGTADTLVDPSNTTALMRQWTDVNGAPQTPTASDTVKGYPHAIYQAGGGAVVETYAITGKDHGIFVDPAGGCGTAAPYVLDAQICGAAYVGRFFGIVPADDLDGGADGAVADGGGADGSGDGAAHADAAPDAGHDGSPGSGGYGGSSSGGSSSGGAPDATAGSSGGAAAPGGGTGGMAGCSLGSSPGGAPGVGALGVLLGLAALRRRSRKTK